MKKQSISFLAQCVVVAFALAVPAQSQVVYQSLEDTYAQDFNALPSSGTTFTWADNATLPGWFAANSTTTSFNPAGISIGSTTSGGLYSFGSSGAAERALGSIGSGASNAGGFFWGVALVNNTGMTISGVTISYTGEQWRSSAAAAQAVSFQYSLSATNVKTGSYTAFPALDFTSPITGGTAGALNGNLAANRTVIGPVTIPNLNWPAGATLWLRWSDPDHAGSDHGLAIDDFTFKAAGSTGQYDAPAGYYASATGLTGYDLEAALHHLVAPHTIIPFNSNNQGVDTWAALKVLDEDPADPTKVRLVYSGVSALKTDSFSNTNTGGWDREHLWPPSRGVGSSGADYNDLFNLRPITLSLAAARSNKIYDEPILTDSAYRMPAATGAAADTSTDATRWKPTAEERGDIARSLFYMDVRYDGNSAVDPQTTDLVLENVIADPSDMARLETLIQWSHDDPVSDAERRRNALVYANYQHNRNPFVDHPEYVDALYGNLLSSLQDADQDGMPTTWESDHGLDADDPSDALADADGDGVTNYQEYWMGTDPQNAADPAVLWVNGSTTSSVQNGGVATPFKTIQAAVDAASATTTTAIRVKDGWYYERLYVQGKARIHLFSENGPERTFISGDELRASAVRLYGFDKASFVGFTVCQAETDWYGAGIRVDAAGGQLLLANNKIINNISVSSTTGGGGIYLKTASGSRIVNNVIAGNQGTRGAGVLFAGGDVQFWNNTVVSNGAIDHGSPGFGGGLAALNGVHPDVRNNIIWANRGAVGYEQIQLPSISNNLIQGAPNDGQNLNVDPLFVNSTSYGIKDYHLSATSPAIDTGVNLPLTYDLENSDRPDSGSEHFDLGAYEAPPATPPNDDSDNNGIPDAWEQANFGHHGIDPNDDPDGDGFSNLQEWQNGTNPNDFFNGQTPVLTLVSENPQTGPAGGFLSKPLVVAVSNSSGAILYNAPVTFTVTSGGGTLQKTNLTPAVTTLALIADTSGQAKAFFKLPASTTAPIQITVTSGKGSHIATKVFTASIDTGSTTYKDPFDPSDMVATLNPDGSVDASWTNNTDPADTDPINIRYRGPGGTWKTAITVPAGTTSAHIPAQ